MGVNEDLKQERVDLFQIETTLAKEKANGGYTRKSKAIKVSIWTRILSLRHKIKTNG